MNGVIRRDDKYNKGLLFTVLITAILLFILLLAVILPEGKYSPSMLVQMLLLTIGAVSVFEIASDKRYFSLNKVHWYFIYVFLSVTPLFQYLSGYYAWSYHLSDTDYSLGALIVLLWCAVYSISFRLKSKKSETVNYSTLPEHGFIAPILLGLSVFSFAYLSYRVGGFGNLFIRGEAWIDTAESIDTILSYLLRAIPALSLAILFTLKRNYHVKFSWLYIIAILPIVVVANYPVSLSRYWSGVIYLGLLITVLPAEFFRNRRFDFFVLIIICVLFPLLYQLKFVSQDEFLSTAIPLFFSNYSDAFNAVDFDAFSLLCRIVQYTNTEGLMLGRQLISVVFFFVPRAVFPIKGLPTGSLVATAQGASFTNLSAPIMAEGYVDFGIIGVILYSIVFSRIIRWFDDKAWTAYVNKELGLTYISVIYPFLFGFLIFVMRGALQPTFLRVMGFFLFLMIIYFLQKIFRKQSGNPAKKKRWGGLA